MGLSWFVGFFSLVTVYFGLGMAKDICVNGGGDVYKINGVIKCVNLSGLDYCKDSNDVIYYDVGDIFVVNNS